MDTHATEEDLQKLSNIKRLARQKVESFLEDLETILTSDGSDLCPKCKSLIGCTHRFCGMCGEDLRPLMLVCQSCSTAINPLSHQFKCCIECGSSWDPIPVPEYSGEIRFPDAS